MTPRGTTLAGDAVELAPFKARALWIAWERHRRSRELAAALGIPLATLLSRAPYAVRALVLSARTILVLATRRPSVLFAQNPSMVLATLACALRPLFRYRLVIDRHSNFRLHERDNPALKWRIFHAMSRYTIRAADLTIVTNDVLKALVEDWGGRGFTLPDKIPAMALATPATLPALSNAVFICSHEEDEPVKEVLQAAAALPDIDVYITGNPRTTLERYAHLVPPNVHLTGYLPEAAYQSLVASCDVVLSLTTAANTLLCGAYEAVAVGRPLVLSDQKALTNYFSKGRITTDNTAEGLARAVREAVQNSERLRAEMQLLKIELSKSWTERWKALLKAVTELLGAGRSERRDLHQPYDLK